MFWVLIMCWKYCEIGGGRGCCGGRISVIGCVYMWFGIWDGM